MVFSEEGLEGEIGEAGGQVRPPEIAEGKGERGNGWEIFRRGRRKWREEDRDDSSGKMLRKLASSEEGMKTDLWRISERFRERQEAKEDWKTRERRSLKRVSIGGGRRRKREMAESVKRVRNA